MNELMLELKKHYVTMDIYPNTPVTNGFMVRFRHHGNKEMYHQDYLIDIEMLIGPYLAIDRILLGYLHEFVKLVEEKESV